MHPCNVIRLPPPSNIIIRHKKALARTLVRAPHSSALGPAPAYGPSLDPDEQHIPSIRYYPTAQVASGEESVSDMEKPMVHGSHADPTQLPPVIQLPPFSHLASQDCLPRYQLQPLTSSPPANFLHFRHHSAKHNEPMPFAHTQGNLSIDAMNANMGLPHATSILLAGHDEASTNLPQTQATTQDHHSPTPPQNTNSTEREMRTPVRDAAADATFLLKILQLRDLDRIPTPCDLHTTLRIEPSLLERMTTSLLEMSFSPEIIILAAALISRAATLRRLTPIFPHDSAWYSEGSTPEATLVIALRVAQLYFTQEPLDGREFYPTLGFYPYDEMASFARRFGVLVFKAPIALAIERLDLQTWRALKMEFERGRVHADGAYGGLGGWGGEGVLVK